MNNSEEIAELFVDMGLYEQLDQLFPIMQQLDNLSLIESAHFITGVNRSHETICTAINRASKVVYALKSFSHHDSSGQMITHNVSDGMNTVLVLYQNLLKQGCELVKDIDDLPQIYCYPDELNQVWTNLVHNALQAMKNKGTLSIKARRVGNIENPTGITVTVTDTGPGIPNKIKDCIFDSFFSTKPAGEGTGLGLGICKRIVDKHFGQIHFETELGCTSFIVRLPINAPSA